MGLFICFVLIFYSSYSYSISGDIAFFVSAENEIVDPVATDPVATDPETTDPAATEPTETDPGTTDPGTTDPAATDPEPTNTDPDATDIESTPEETTDKVTNTPQVSITPRPVQSDNEDITSTFTRRRTATPSNSASPIIASNTIIDNNDKGIIIIVKIIGYTFFVASFFMAIYGILYALQSLFPRLIKWNIPRFGDSKSTNAFKPVNVLNGNRSEQKKPNYIQNSGNNGNPNVNKTDETDDYDDWNPLG